MTAGHESFHGAVSRTRRDQDRGRRAMFHGEIPKSAQPRERLFGRHERRLHQDKDPKIDPVAAQEACRSRELIEGHALVESGENFWMRPSPGP